MERQKSVFIEAVCRKGIYLCTLVELGDIMEGEWELPSADDLNNDISELWHMLLKFVDPVDSKVSTVLHFDLFIIFIYIIKIFLF